MRYHVELRASPDTPREEHKAGGRVMGPQTVVWEIEADSAEEAGDRAIVLEFKFLYRKDVELFEVKQIDR